MANEIWMQKIDKMKIQKQNEMKIKIEMKIKNENEMKILQQQETPQRFSQAKYHRWEFLI